MGLNRRPNQTKVNRHYKVNETGRQQPQLCSIKHINLFVNCIEGFIYSIPLLCGRKHIGQRERRLNEQLRKWQGCKMQIITCMSCTVWFTCHSLGTLAVVSLNRYVPKLLWRGMTLWWTIITGGTWMPWFASKTKNAVYAAPCWLPCITSVPTMCGICQIFVWSSTL